MTLLQQSKQHTMKGIITIKVKTHSSLPNNCITLQLKQEILLVIQQESKAATNGYSWAVIRSKTAWVNSPHHISCPEFCARSNASSKVTKSAPINNLSKTPETPSCKGHGSVTIVFVILHAPLNMYVIWHDSVISEGRNSDIIVILQTSLFVLFVDNIVDIVVP